MLVFSACYHFMSLSCMTSMCLIFIYYTILFKNIIDFSLCGLNFCRFFFFLKNLFYFWLCGMHPFVNVCVFFYFTCVLLRMLIKNDTFYLFLLIFLCFILSFVAYFMRSVYIASKITEFYLQVDANIDRQWVIAQFIYNYSFYTSIRLFSLLTA